MKLAGLTLLFGLIALPVHGTQEGERIYLEGRDSDGSVVPAVINQLESSAAMPCANCHRESGLGTSESGLTIPPVSWRFLGQSLPLNNDSRFDSIQNKRPAYTTQLVHRLLTTGVDARGELTDPLMPRYDLSPDQTSRLVDYLKTLYAQDDPGVNGETITIATIVDAGLPEAVRVQHLNFLQGLFDMKNAGTRGEARRKEFSPIQKVPQYEAYRIWELTTWELPANPEMWPQTLERYYRQNPVFVVLAPYVSADYSKVQAFCRQQNLPCLFPHQAGAAIGDYYNFVYRNPSLQIRNYLQKKRRDSQNPIFYLDTDHQVTPLPHGATELPVVRDIPSQKLVASLAQWCSRKAILLIHATPEVATSVYGLNCKEDQPLEIVLLAEPETTYLDIAGILERNPASKICWASNYDRVLKRNLREIRVSLLARKFGMGKTGTESLARDLFAFGLLTDAMHQLAGTFSRRYLLEILEHMLNSYPNYTFYSSISGAPYQRTIVGPIREYCPSGGYS